MHVTGRFVEARWGGGRGFFFDPGGNSFELIANSWSEHLCQVMNVRFATAAMDTDPEAVKRVHKTLKGE